jgi:hypothetical protein
METILNGLLVKTLDEVGHLKNLLDSKNLELRESREQEKILKGFLDEHDAADAASQNKSVRLETQLVRLETQLSLMTTSYDETTTLLKSSKEKCHHISQLKDKYLRKYMYYWAKAISYLQQLSFVPWLLEVAWSHGYWWGFENLKKILRNPMRFPSVDIKTVTRDTLQVPKTDVLKTIFEYLGLASRMPDASKDNMYKSEADFPIAFSVPSNSESSDDEVCSDN